MSPLGCSQGRGLVKNPGNGCSDATVTVFIDGTPEYEYPNKTLYDGEFWDVGSVEWPGGAVTVVDSVTVGVP